MSHNETPLTLGDVKSRTLDDETPLTPDDETPCTLYGISTPDGILYFTKKTLPKSHFYMIFFSSKYKQDPKVFEENGTKIYAEKYLNKLTVCDIILFYQTDYQSFKIENSKNIEELKKMQEKFIGYLKEGYIEYIDPVFF